MTLIHLWQYSIKKSSVKFTDEFADSNTYIRKDMAEFCPHFSWKQLACKQK